MMLDGVYLLLRVTDTLATSLLLLLEWDGIKFLSRNRDFEPAQLLTIHTRIYIYIDNKGGIA